MKFQSTPLIAVAFMLVACGAPKKSDDDAEVKPKALVEVAPVRQEEVKDTLALDGQFTLAEGHTVKLAPTLGGRLMKVLVKEGQSVTSGQLLAVVDTSVLARQAQSAGAALAAAEAQTRQVQTALKAVTADQVSQVALAKSGLTSAIAERDSNVRQAQLDLQRIRNGARPQEISVAEQVVVQARVARNKARADADRDAKLVSEGYVSGQQADTSRAAYETADSALRQAIAQYDLLRAGSRNEERRAAEDKLQSARKLGDQKVAQARIALRQAEEGILNVQAKREEANATALTAAQKAADARAAGVSVKNGELRAPIAGFVTKRFLSEGDMTDTTVPVYEIAAKGADTDFVGEVSPQDATRVLAGMEVEFASGAGRVTSVGVTNSQTGLIPIRVRVTGKPQPIGTFETARIVLRKIPGAIVVPKAAVVSREGESIVFVNEQGTAKLVKVKVGPVDGDYVAILSGLKAGQQVVMVAQFELADGGQIEVKKP